MAGNDADICLLPEGSKWMPAGSSADCMLTAILATGHFHANIRWLGKGEATPRTTTIDFRCEDVFDPPTCYLLP